MSDVVVTVPKWFWGQWIAEGDPVGAPWSGTEWDFYFRGGPRPDAQPGDRCYIVAHGMLRGYAPIVRVVAIRPKGWSIVRRGDAVAVTIPAFIQGFRGWRRRWWPLDLECPFPDWKTLIPKGKL